MTAAEPMRPTYALSDKAARILDQFPGPITLRPRSLKWRMILLAVMYVLVLGLPIGIYLDSSSSGGFASLPLLMMFVFGIIAIVPPLVMIGMALKVLLTPNSGVLVLDEAGLEYQMGFRRVRCSWQDADGFLTYRVGGGYIHARYVAFDDASRARGFTAATNRFLTGGNARLPDTYGLGAAELVQLLTAWRQLALERKTTPP